MTWEMQPPPDLVTQDSGAGQERMIVEGPPQRHLVGDAGGARGTIRHLPDIEGSKMDGSSRHAVEYPVGMDRQHQ